MSTESSSHIFTCHLLRQDRGALLLGSLKRVLVPLLRRLVRHGEVSYPSPPMSDPSTPSRIPQHDSIPLQKEQQSVTTASTSSSSIHMPGLAVTAPARDSTYYELSSRQTDFDQQPAGHASLMQPVQTPTHPDRGETSTHDPEPSQRAATAPSSRGGRKAKAHVASACINCKRAHLSCDVSRPCARCVASGKQVCLVLLIANSTALTLKVGHLRRCSAQETRAAAIAGRGRVQGRAHAARGGSTNRDCYSDFGLLDTSYSSHQATASRIISLAAFTR